MSSEVRGPTPRGESEAGWIKDAGCVLSPEKCIVVVIGIIPLVWEKADGLNAPEGSSPAYAMASRQDPTGVLDYGMHSWGKDRGVKSSFLTDCSRV